GKSWLFFDKYQLQVTSVYATLATNHRNVALSVNGKHVATSNKATYEHKIGPYVPGSYTLTAKGTVSGHQITNKGTYYLRANGQTYDLDLRTISFTVNGTPNTTVYINGENEGTINSSGTLALNDIPWSNRMMLTGKYKAGSQTLTAKQTNVSDAEGQDVDLKFAGVMSKDTASDYLNGIFTAVSSYTSTGDLSDASDYDDRTLDDYFVNGTDNTDYKELVQMAKGYYDNDDVLDVTYEPTVLSTVPAAKQQSQITYDVKYDFTNSEDERIQVFRYTATVEKTGGHYKIVKITPAQKIRSYTKSDDSDD
ncbi:MAG: TcaA 3rd/4th domain-containing protein, partial [Lactiplantibacillus plantarum]